MEFENEYLWGRAMARPYRVGFWMGFMIIGIFYGTMCTSSQYLMEYCDLGMGFLLQWDLIIWIFVGTRHGTSVQGGILDGVYDNWYFFCVGRCAHRPNI